MQLSYSHYTKNSSSKASGENNPKKTAGNQPSLMYFESTSSSKQTSSVQITNDSGDSVTLSIDSLEFQKTLISGNARMSDDDWKKVIDMVKDEYTKQKEAIIKILQPDSTGKKSKTESTKKEASDEIEGLPEYWNAENTASRIVDFATSFFKASGMNAQEFSEKIRSAIEDGFKQAMNMLGTLPDAVNKLAHDTYSKAMEKLQQWEKDNSEDSSQV